MAAASLTDTQGIVALGAAAVAVVALVGCLLLAVRLRSLSAAPACRARGGGAGHRRACRRPAGGLRGAPRVRRGRRPQARRAARTVELALQGAISHCALVRYDAYNELSGHQSVSIALLDSTRSGVVLSCIHHRDQARVYAKQVHARPQRARALARGGRGGRPGALPTAQRCLLSLRRPRRGGSGRWGHTRPRRLPRARGDLQRGGAARQCPARLRRARRARHHLRHRHRRPQRRRRAGRSRRSRTRSTAP